MKKLRNTFNSIYQWTAKNSFFSSVRLSFLYLSPIFLLGAFSIVLQNFPIEAVRVFFATAIGGRINVFLQLLYNATYGFASVYLVIALSYVVVCAETKQPEIRAIAVISSLTCFFAFLGPEVFSEAARILNYTRMSNVFSALVVSFFVHKTFHLVVQNLLQKAFGKRNVLCARTSRIATDVVLFNVVGNHCRAYFVCERREQFRRFVGCVFV